MHLKAAKKLINKVENDYNEISKEFSSTRQHPWPEFKLFEKYLQKPYIKDNSSILDLGCGNGRLLTMLEPYIKEKKLQYTGVDISQGLLNHAKSHWKNQTFKKGSQLKIPLPDNSQDQIWNIAAFHHIPSRPLKLQALQEMHRTLKPGGLLIMTNWNTNQPKYRPQRIKALIKSILTLGQYSPSDRFIPWSKTGVDRYYYNFTPKELKRLLEDSNFKIIDIFCTQKEKIVPFKESFNICTIAQKK